MASGPKTLAEAYYAATGTPEFVKLSPTERINAVLAVRSPNDVRFLSKFFEEHVKLAKFETFGSRSVATFRFRVERLYCNLGGNLHGAAQTMIYDQLTSMTLQATGEAGAWVTPGVSRNLNCSYLRPAPEGTICLCECEVVHSGKRLALLRGVIKRESDGAVISTCDHDKAFMGPFKPKI